MDRQFAFPKCLEADDIKRIRNSLNMSQKEFASFLGVSKPTVERWEAGKIQINGPAAIALFMIENDREYFESLEIPPKTTKVRLCYMHRQRLCTIIDVDNINQTVKIKNFVSNIMFKAFGVKEKPTYEDYKEFLKSRCFPETRDKLKLVLEDLGVPFYDPYLIIQKTEGRMAEDDFWIKIE